MPDLEVRREIDLVRVQVGVPCNEYFNAPRDDQRAARRDRYRRRLDKGDPMPSIKRLDTTTGGAESPARARREDGAQVGADPSE
jgi:hypothetical protein